MKPSFPLSFVGLTLLACSSSGSPTGNQAPTLDAPAFVEVREGESVTFTVKVSDANKDAVSLVATASAELTVLATPKSDPLAGFDVKIDASHETGDHTVSLSVSDGKETRKVDVDVRVARMTWGTTWKLTPDGVEAREHPSVIFDTARDRILILGGSGYKPQGKPLADTFQVSTKSGKATPLTITGAALPAIASMRVAEVPGTQTAYLFGGYGEDGAGAQKLSSDLYLADYSGESMTLTLVTPNASAGPSARELHGLSYDEMTKRLFVFAGIDSSNTILNDLWVGTVAGSQVTWTEKTPAVKPTKRYGFFYGQYEGRTLIFSGAQGTASVKPARDVWALDTRSAEPSYAKLLEGEEVPAGRRNGCFAVDQKRGRFFIYGGTPDAAKTLPGLWLYDAREGQGRFTDLATREGAPPLRSSGSAVIDPRDGTAYFGFGNDNNVYSDLTRFGF
jgi:hypothetical protein